MKKILACIISVLFIFNVASAKGFFSNRIFELRMDVPVNISNNVFSMNDILVKDLVIDLRKIADTVPKTGLTAIMEVNPSIATNLNILGVGVGAKVGLNGFMKLNLSKGLFDFFGYGYKVGDTLDISLSPVVDLFAYAEVPVSFKVLRFKVGVTPSVFMPVATLNDCKAGATFKNDADGNFAVNVDADINVYTSAIYDAMSGQASMDSISFGDYLGFDLAGYFEMPFFFEDLDLRVDARIPIVPGKLDRKINVKYNMEIKQNLMEMANPPAEPEKKPEDGKEPKPGDNNKPGETGKPSESGKPDEPAPAEPEMGQSIPLENPFYINRPMKINAYAVYNPIGFLTLVGGGGCGIRHPFGEGFYMYPEYYFSATVSLFDILKATASTEYTDEMFKHQLTGVFNLRFFELDLGVSLQSGNFVQSFNMAGFGAKIGVVLGF